MFLLPLASLCTEEFGCDAKTDVIFGNILEVHDFVVNFLGVLEETMEMTPENSPPQVNDRSKRYHNYFSETH